MSVDRNDIELAFARWAFRHLEGKARRRLWTKLAKLIENGVPILSALSALHDRRQALKGSSDPVVMALDTWITGMKNGQRLSTMLEGWIDPSEQMIIAAGETSGALEQSLNAAIRVSDSGKAIQQAIVQGLAYPVILVMVSFAVLYLFGLKVVPEFTRIVPAEKFTGLAAFLVQISEFAKNWLLVSAGVVVGIVTAYFISLPRWDGELRIWLDRYAPYSIYRIVKGSGWLISLAALLEAGVRLENALHELASMSDKWLATRIEAAMLGMRAGYHLGDALSQSGYGFPDQEIIDDLGIYASLSGFDEALSILGKEWLSESVAQIKERMNAVFGVSLICVAILIGTMLGGMMTMQMQMSQVIQQNGR